jgi:hypothetical protein
MKGPALALLSAAVLFGCAHFSNRDRGPKTPPIAVGSKNSLYVAAPAVPDSVDSLLASVGWGGGRFSAELRKEIIFQFNRKGVAAVEDSLKADASLTSSVTGYVQDGASSHFEGGALLKTPAGERRIGFQKPRSRGQAPERDDPTVDNLRMIAAALVKESTKDPAAKKAKEKVEYVPQMMILF